MLRNQEWKNQSCFCNTPLLLLLLSLTILHNSTVIYIIFPCLSPSNSSMSSTLLSLRFMTSSLIMYLYVFIFVYRIIYKYNLLNPIYCCSYVYVFRVYCLGLDNLLGALLWRRLISSQWQLMPVALHVGIGPCEIFPVHTGMSSDGVAILVLLRQPDCWDFMDLSFPVLYRRPYLEVSIQVHWLLQSFHLLFWGISYTLGMEAVLYICVNDSIFCNVKNRIQGRVHAMQVLCLCHLTYDPNSLILKKAVIFIVYLVLYSEVV